MQQQIEYATPEMDSVQDVAQALGLQDPDKFELEQMCKLTDPEWIEKVGDDFALEALRKRRGTGRTTRMLLEAVLEVDKGCGVYVVGQNNNATRLHRDRLASMLRHLQLPTHLILSSPGIPILGNTRIFKDLA